MRVVESWSRSLSVFQKYWADECCCIFHDDSASGRSHSQNKIIDYVVHSYSSSSTKVMCFCHF